MALAVSFSLNLLIQFYFSYEKNLHQ